MRTGPERAGGVDLIVGFRRVVVVKVKGVFEFEVMSGTELHVLIVYLVGFFGYGKNDIMDN
jgi:hypothetical protein